MLVYLNSQKKPTMKDAAPAIETHHLKKTFGDKVAVQDLTLKVERGEVFGFLGPNGAGKTTSVKMLLNLVAPLRWCGLSLWRADH